MDEFADYEEELKGLFFFIQSSLSKSLYEVQALKTISQIKSRLVRARQLVKSMQYVLQTASLLDVSTFQKKVAYYEVQIQAYQQELDSRIASCTGCPTEDTFMRLKESGEHKNDQQQDFDLLNEYLQLPVGQITSNCKAMQKNTLESTARSKAAIEETATIGKETRQTVATQRERLQSVDNGLDRVDGNIRMANRQIRIFIRRMATDKLVMFLLVLVILGVIACAIVPFVVKRK